MNFQPVSSFVPEFSRDWALFLDVDGTLIDFAPRPDQVSVSKELVVILDDLKAKVGDAIALISGRPTQDLDHLFKPVKFPMAGQHGLERRDVHGAIHLHSMPDGEFTLVKTSIKEFAEKRKNLFVEDKGHSIAIHYRQVQESKLELENLLDTCMKKIGMNFHLQSGKMVYEIKPHGKDMTSPPKTVPVFKLETRLNWITKEVKHAEKTLLTRRDHQTPTLS